jgi:hypothetical protein
VKKTTVIARSVFGNLARVEILPEGMLDHLCTLAELPKGDEAEALGRMRAVIDARLQVQGWPSLDVRITVDRVGAWHITEDMDGDLAGGNVRILPGRTFIEAQVEPLSTGWFLVRMADHIMRLIDGLRRDDAPAVLRDALALGADMRELELIQLGARRWAEAGKKSRDGAAAENERRIRESFASLHGAMAQELANKISGEHPNWPWTQIRKSLLNKLKQDYGIDVSDETVKKSLRNPRGR